MEENRTAQAAPDDRVSREVREFVEAYPDVRPEELDEAVWTAVRAGRSLTAAYRETRASRLEAENRRLKDQLEAEARNGRNRAVSLGSQQTHGGPAARDAFVEALLGDG